MLELKKYFKTVYRGQGSGISEQKQLSGVSSHGTENWRLEIEVNSEFKELSRSGSMAESDGFSSTVLPDNKKVPLK